MKKNIAIGILVLVVVVLVAYVVGTRQLSAPTTSNESATTTTSGGKLAARDIKWAIVETEDDQFGTPHAEVSVSVDGKKYVIGTYAGFCSELSTGGGIDGKGLLAGELSAVQCYFAGGGNELAVFANEGGGYDVMVGDLGEGDEDHPFFRGNFKIVATQY